MDRLKYHQERLDAKLGFKRDENFRYDFDPIVPGNVLAHQENDGIVPKNQQKNTQYHLGFQTGATFDVDESYKESNAYKKYMQTRPEALEEAKKISDTTGIPYDAIIEDSESMAKAREIYDYKKKVMDFSKVYERYPELKKLNEADGAISLHNIQDVKRVHGDFEALKVGWNTDSLWAERNILGLDKFLGKQVDEKKLEELNQKIQELKEIPTLDEDISMAILGNSTQQARMMVRHFIQSLDTVALGATAGAIGNAVLNRNNIAMAPALIAGARTALPVAFKTGMAIEMFKESVGSNYLTYTGYKDKFGNQLLSDSDARLYATATALIETGVEFANYDAVIGILKSSKKTINAAKVIENIVKNSKDTASVMAQLKTLIATNAKNFGAVALGETAEEGVQQISEMGITQIARVNNPEGNIPQYSGSDILKGGVEAAVAAFPASIGLGGMAVGASGLRFTRHAAQLLSLGKERADEALRTQTGVNLLNSLMQAAQDTKLGQNHKETFNKLMKSNLEGTVHETAYVDSELLLEEEGGIHVFNQLAAAAGYTEEQINTLRETGAPIKINTADVVSTIAGASEINIADYVSFDAADRCFARNQKVAKELNGLLQKVKTEEVERTINNINTLTTEMFGETEERDLATMIIAEFEDPIAGIEERRSEINREISDMIDPVVEEMRGGMGQGVELYATDDYGNIIETGDGAHIGGAVRLSNNAPWYSKYYKANKKRPSEQELRELAEEVITGNNEYGVGDYDYTDPGMVEYAEETKARLENLRHELELLNNIEPKLKDVNKGDFAALDALSEDGVKVYKAIMDKLRSMPNKDVQRAASMGALIYAHRAETHAEAMRILGNKKYTALDYMASHPVEFGGEAVKGALGQSAAMRRENKTVVLNSQGNLDWGYINGAIADDGTEIKKAPVRMQIGFQVGEKVAGNGYTHIANRRKSFLAAKEYKSIEDAITDVLENVSFVVATNTSTGQRLMLVKDIRPADTSVALTLDYVEDEDGAYYSVNSLLPRSKKQVANEIQKALFFAGRRLPAPITGDGAVVTLASSISAGTPKGLLPRKNSAYGTVSLSEADKLVKKFTYSEDDNTLNQTAWHGTGAIFDVFDLGAMGTGEGNQVHGWGLYFAQDKDIANNYKEMLSAELPDATEVMIGKKSLQQIYEEVLNDIDRGNGDIDVLSEKQAMLENYISGKYEKDAALLPAKEMGYSQESINWFNELVKDLNFNKGSLFEVDVPENDVLLDEQKTFKEQSTKVRKAITKLVNNLTEDQLANFDDVYSLGKAKVVQKILKSFEEIDGGTIYGTIYDLIEDEGTGKGTSELLNEYGVKGIAYDGGTDGRCFVVFDDKAIAVINRFNQAAGQKAETANLAALQEAMAMYDNYEDAKTIYEKTGWYRGADEKWRFDIPDNFDKINLDELPEEGRIVKLGELYDNPALYKAYPWLKEIWVHVANIQKGYRGTADYANGVIEISSALVKKGTREVIGIGSNRFIRTKTDEDIEEWYPLSGDALDDIELQAVSLIMDKNNDVDKAIVEAQADVDRTIESIKFNEERRPDSMILQVRKQNLKEYEKILKCLEKIKKEGFGYTSYDFTDEAKTRNEIGKTLVHEIQHLIQSLEGFAVGGNPVYVGAQMRRQIDIYRRKAVEIDQNAHAYYWRHRDWEAAIIEGKSAEIIQELQKDLRFVEELVPEENRQPIIDLLSKADTLERQLKESINAFFDYENLHGEQEARAASRKAEKNTKIERLKEARVKPLDEILENHIGSVAPENQDALREWVEIVKAFENGDNREDLSDRIDVLEEQLKGDAGAQAFFKDWEDNEKIDWDKAEIPYIERSYQHEVLEGVSPYNAIIVFDGNVLSGYSVGPKGQTVLKSTGEKVIKLFESADESTFIHEIAHVAYEDLRELASYANAPAQFKRDIKTLDDWANWKDGQLKEYEGTSTYKEFAQRDAAIREALANNDIATAEQLKYEWRQERFARGFEEYLKKGKAPTEGLRKVFYQFKTWLTKIYRAYRGIGGVPTKEVEAVMTRLLLTEEAIELAEKKAEIDAFEKSGVFNYLGDNAKAMWQKILEDVRKDATSKVLKIAMKDMSELAKKERQEKIDAERQAAYERLSKEPVWAVYSYLKYNPKMDTLAACKLFGLTVEEYVGLLKANGGSLERAVENYMVNYIAELEAPKNADIEARAEEAMTTSYYKTLLSAFETEMLQREVRREARLSKKLAGIVAKDETERAEIEKSLRELDKKGDEAKAQRALRDVAVGNVEKIRQYAKEKLALMDISYSANPVVWKNASRQKAAEMTEALAKKDYNKAVFASKMRLVYDAMADIATESKKLVDRKSKQMRDRAKTIRREKNMGANDRYVYNHLLYAFGLAERDVPRPPQFTTFNEVLISYDSTLSMPFIGDNGELLISDFIINAGTGTGKAVKGIHELTVSEFTELANVMDNIYTVAVEANKIKTVTTTEGETITVDQALAEIMDDAFNRHKEKEVVDTTMAGNVKKMDDVLDTANRIHISLLKAETILDELSSKATKYIYDPIKRGAEKELKMTVEYGEKIEAIRQAWLDGKIEKYLNQGLSEDEAKKAAEKEIEEAFTVERYKLGTSNITKENIIAFALNWGTEINRKRAMNYPGTTTRDFERIFAEMDGADWQFVTNVWDLFEETWPQLKQVEANVSGVTLEKQEGITFNITGKDGANYIIQGKYYPIKYDPKKNQKVQRQQKEEGVRTNLPSMARMGVGIGMTKERAVSTSYLMRNDLGVFAEAIQENIHLICMREAVRDASRLINDERFADTIKRTLGGNALSALQDWVLDCWQLEPKVKNDFESAMAYLRRKQTTAVLAFRLSTALLNVANIGPVMHYLGMGRTKKALMDFYAHPIEQYNFVIERSPFVKNRAQTMDRDMRDIFKGEGIGDKMNKLEAMGFYMITKTDLMLACPLWLSEYQRVYRENAEQLSAEQIERMAVDAGDKAVRNVFGSGMVQDLAAVQRGGEVTKMLTMYYSYFSVVQQAVSKSAFEYNRRKVNGDEWYKRWAPVANTIVHWLIIPSAITVGFKMAIEAATGDDDDEITFENFIKRTGADTINAAAGGVPILRDVVNMAMAYAVEGKYYGARSTSIGETTEKMMDVIRSIKGFADEKKDLDDVLRAVFRATAYTTGIPVVGADALSTMYQWIAYGDATPEEITEYLIAILFDKKVKK